MGKVLDWQQLTYLGIVRDSTTAAPIPPSLQALRISRNVWGFTFLDVKMLQHVRLELGRMFTECLLVHRVVTPPAHIKVQIQVHIHY